MFCVIFVTLLLPGGTAYRAHAQQPAAEMRFDIPSEALVKALETFAMETGCHLYYDSSLAANRRSASVAGQFSPRAALQALLAGTGYVVTPLVDQNAFTITYPVQQSAGQTPPAQNLMASFGPFLAVMQSAISRKLCADTALQAEPEDIFLSFWIDDSGAISDVQILEPDNDPALNAEIGTDIIGLSFGQRPPAGMPQPVTMAIFTAAAD